MPRRLNTLITDLKWSEILNRITLFINLVFNQIIKQIARASENAKLYYYEWMNEYYSNN